MTKDQIIQKLHEYGVIPCHVAGSDGLVPLHGGRVAEHVYRFDTPGGRPLAVKVVRPNEALILRVLAHLRSPLVPSICCPKSIGEGLLIWHYLDPAAVGPLHPDLAKAYAQFHNATDDGKVFVELGLPAKLEKSGQEFYIDTLHRCFSAAMVNLAKLQGYAWPVLDSVRKTMAKVGEREDQLAERFGNTPFAWIHNDFRNENIVGNPPKLIDWGSSYGYGPYLYDIGPYLVESDEAMRAFAGESAIYQSRSQSARQGDLLACTAAALTGYLHWHLGDMLKDGEMERVRSALERRRKQYRRLQTMLATG